MPSRLGDFWMFLAGNFYYKRNPKYLENVLAILKRATLKIKLLKAILGAIFVKKIAQLFTSASSHTELTFSIMWLDPSPLNKLDQHLLSSSQMIKFSQWLCPYLSLYPISHNWRHQKNWPKMFYSIGAVLCYLQFKKSR